METVSVCHMSIDRFIVGMHGQASLQRKLRSLGALIAGFKSAAIKRININSNYGSVIALIIAFVGVYAGRSVKKLISSK